MLNTSSKQTFRFIQSATLSAKENMAIDKALFENFSETWKPVLRLYSWEKSFTYGISAKVDELLEKKELQAYSDYAKRMTGGGILFHGHDISYALVIPTEYVKGLTVKQSYEKICQFLLNFYLGLGLKASFAKDDESISLSHSEYCQLGFEDYDIIINGIKMGGNAQRRGKDVIFQHGSIGLFNLDESLQTGNALTDVGVKLNFEEATEKLRDAFKETFDVVLETSVLTDKEEKRAKALEKEG